MMLVANPVLSLDRSVKERDDGLRNYYVGKIEELQIKIRDKTQNFERLKAQRNELCAFSRSKFCVLSRILICSSSILPT